MLAARNFFPRLFGVHPIPFVSQLPLVGVAFVLQLLCMQTFAVQVLAQSGTPAAPERIVSPVRSDLPGRTVWAFATTGTGTSVTTFAATDRGLFRSSGTTWSETMLRNQAVYAVKSRRIGNPSGGSTVTLLAGTDRGVQRSVDNGATWQSVEVTTGSVGATSNVLSVRKVFDIEIIQPGNGSNNGTGNGNSAIWFAATEKGVFRSSNDGRSWTLVNIDRTVDNNEVRGITTDGNTIIVNLWREGLWRSTNNGNSWSKLIIAGETALCRAVHAHTATNGTVWLAGSVAGNIWRSVNNGSSWTRVYQTASTNRSASPSALTQAGIDAFASWERRDNQGNYYTYCFAATPQGIAFSFTDGAAWSLTRTTQTKAITLTAWNNRLYAGAEDNTSTFVAAKGQASLNSGGDGSSNEYEIICGEAGAAPRSCGGGGSSSGGSTSGGTTTLIPFPTIAINGVRPNPIDPPGINQQFTIRGQELHHNGTAVEWSSDTAFTGANAVPNVSFNPTQLTFTFGGVLTHGVYWFRVRNGGGTSNREPLAVGTGVFMRSVQIAPAGARSGDQVTMTIRGVGLRTATSFYQTQLVITSQGVELPQNTFTYTRPSDTVMTVTFVAPPAGQYAIALRNNDGSSVFTTSTVPWTLLQGTPTLSSISPTTAIAGQTVSFRAVGTRFNAGAELLLDDALVPGIVYGTHTATELNATFPAPAAKTYQAKIRVVEQSSPTLPFTVSNPQAVITSITTSPSPAVAFQPCTVTVQGSGFLSGITSVLVNGGAVSINAPTVTASAITFSFTPQQGGSFNVSILNPGTSAATGSFSVVAPPPAPTLTNLSTDFIEAGSAQQTITLTGQNFQTNSKVLVDADSLTVTTTYISPTQLSATIPAAKFVLPNQTLQLSVATPPFFGIPVGRSASLSFYVPFPRPTLTSVSPALLAVRSVQAGNTQTLTFEGTRLYPGTAILWDFNTPNVSTLPFVAGTGVGTSGINANSAQYALGAAFFSEPKLVRVVLRNPAHSAAPLRFPATESEERFFRVTNVQPVLTSVTPRTIVWDGAAFDQRLTASGTDLFGSSRLVVASDNNRELVPSGSFNPNGTADGMLRITGLGTYLIKASNPAIVLPGEAASNLLSVFTDTVRVVNPAPSVTTVLQPIPLNAISATYSLSLTGTSFMDGVTASVAGLPASVVRNSPSSITLTFTQAIATALTQLGAGVYHIVITNPAPSMGAAALTLTLTNPALSALTLSPSPWTLNVPTTPATLTLTAGAASAFASNASVSVNGTAIPPANITRTSPTQLSVVVPVPQMTPAGTFTVTVQNPNVAVGQPSSASALWVVQNPRPVVTGLGINGNLGQTTVTMDGNNVAVSVFGQLFMPGASVRFRGQTLSVQTFTSNRLDLSIPASLLDSAGVFPMTVTNTNGGGDAVNQPTLTVLAPQPRLLVLAPPSSVRSLTNQQPIQLGLGGSGFVRGSRVVWGVGVSNTPLAATYSNANQLSVSVPANLLTQAGTFRLVVVNDALAGQGGGISDTLSFILQNPTASLVSVNPTLLPRFAASAALTLTGDNFVQGARVLVTGLNNVVDTLTAQVLSPTEAQITLPASLLDSAVTLQIRVLNPAPVLSASGVAQASVVNPRPRLSSMNPTQTLTGLASLTVNVQGTSFMDGVTGFANGLPVPTNRQNDNNAVLTLPASVLAQAGTVVITLQNPTPRVQPEFSDSLSLTVNNPLPRLDSAVGIGQSSLVVSTQATTVTLFGDSFILASQVKENGASTSGGSRSETTLSSSRLSLNQITTVVPPGMTAEAGTVRLTVENPTPGGGRSQSVVMNVLHPVPLAERITPSVVVIPTSDLSITITGDRFVNTAGKASEVLLNGAPVSVQSRTATRITATIPATMLATRGFYAVTVRNAATNGSDGGTSEALTLRVNTPQPLLTALSPAQIPLDTLDVPLTITGSRFLPDAIVRITTPDGVNATVATTSLTATEIRTTLPASLVSRGGIYSLRVENPAPTDALSAPLTFALVNPVPQMDSISPKVVTPQLNTQNSTLITEKTITVFGQKFTPTSVVRWRGQDLATTFVSRTSLTAIIPPAQQVRGAVGAVTVFTPTDGVVVGGMPVGGGTGSALGTAGVLTLTHGTPSLTSSTPAALLRDAWSANALPSITLNGQLFVSTATVRVRSTAPMNAVDTVLTPTSVNANGLALVVTMPRAVMTTAGTFSLTVTNPPAFPNAQAPSDGGTSASFSLTVQNPTPTLSSLAPASLAAASPNTLLTVNGANFTRETQLFVNGMPAERVVLSASQLTTTLPASLFTLSGFVRVQVLNPVPSQSGAASGDSSNTLSLEVFNPVPTFTGVSPVFAPIGGRSAADSVTLTLVGTNFVRNSVARIATTVVGAPTTDLPTTFVATTTLTVRLLAADWRAQAYNLTVLNPAPRGGTSVARRFTVTNPLPILTALLPNSTTASGRAWTLRVIGNFFTSTSQVSYNRALQSLANTTYIPNSITPSTQDTLLVRLPAVPVGDTTFPVVVVNPPTGGVGGGASDTLRLAIGLPAPTITSLSPASTTATLGDKNRAWTLTVNGTLFDDAAKVFVNGQQVYTEFVSTTRLRAVFPDSLQAVQARRSVQVRNTALLVSNLVPHIVQNPAPVLTTIDPVTIIAGRDTVLTLTGDRFAPDAAVRLTFGTTATTLIPQSRDSVIGLTVRIPAALTPVRGAYSLRVSNPALAPTMVPPDTLALGGGLSAAQTLTVNADVPHSVEYIGLDTLLNTGDRLWFFTLRFRDKTGNLVDNDPVTLTYTNLDSTVVTGYFPITRTSLGTYRADTLRFPVAGRYLVQVDTGLTGRLVVLGQDRFTVLTRAATRVELEGVTSTFTAGDSLPRLTFRYFDSQNNLTDLGSRIVIVTATVGGTAYRDTLLLNRTQTGVYTVPAQRTTGAAFYTITPLGIATANITGERTFTVTPRPASQVAFSGVTPALASGGVQTRFRATLRDTFQNLTDVAQWDSLTIVQPTHVAFTMSTDATYDDSTRAANAGWFTIQRTSLGVFTADVAAPFLQSGNYALSMQGISSTSGTAAFVVRPNVDFRVVFENVPDTLTAGDSLKNVVVRYFDRNDNPTDNSLGRITYARAGGSSTATVSTTRLETGVYALNSTQATIAGTYTLSVAGITSVNMTGTRNFVVMPTIATKASFIASTSAMNAAGAVLSLTASFFDIYNNPTDRIYDVSVRNDEFHFTDTVGLTRSRQGVYTARKTLKFPGDYVLRIDSLAGELNPEPPPEEFEILNDRFSLEPGPANRAVFTNVPASVIAGNALPRFTVRLFDRRNAPTDYTATGETQVNVTPPTTAQNQPSFLLGTFEPEDNQNGTYNVMRVDMAVTEPMKQFTNVGTYTLTVPGCTRYQGNRVFAVQAPPQAASVTFENVRSGLSVYEPQNAIRAIFRDASGNLTDNINVTPLAITLRLPDNSTTSLALQQVSQGIYAITQPTTGYDQSGLYSLRVGTLTVLDQGFFSVAEPLYLNSVMFVNTTIRNSTDRLNYFNDTGLDFGTLSIGNVSQAQMYRIVYRGSNRVRVASLPVGFEVSTDRTTWSNSVGDILLLPNPTSVATSGNVRIYGGIPDRLIATTPNSNILNIADANYAIIWIRYRPLAATALNAFGNLTLQAGNLTNTVRLQGTATTELITAQEGVNSFPALKLHFPNSVVGGAEISQTFTIAHNNVTSYTITPPNGYRISLTDCANAQSTPITINPMGAAGTQQIRVCFNPTTAGAFQGVIEIRSSTGRTHLTIPTYAAAYQATTQGFAAMPRVKTLLLYTRGAAAYIARKVQDGTAENSCIPNVIYGSGLNIYDHFDKSIYLNNRVNYNSGLNLRVTTDPVPIENPMNFTTRNPMIVPIDSVITLNDGTQSRIFPEFVDNGNVDDPVEGCNNFFSRVFDIIPNSVYQRLRALLGNNQSALTQYRRRMGADQVVLVANVSLECPDLVPPRRIGGKAATQGSSNESDSYFIYSINQVLDEFIFTHEAGHVWGLGHNDGESSVLYRGYPLQQDACNRNEENRPDRSNPLGTMWPASTIMASGPPYIPFWTNPNIYYPLPQTGVARTLQSGNPNEIATLNTIGTQVSNIIPNYPHDQFDARIDGPAAVAQGASATYTAALANATGTVSYQWFTMPLRQTAQRLQAIAGATGQSLTFTPTAQYTLLRVVMVHSAGANGPHIKISADYVISCATCAPLVSPFPLNGNARLASASLSSASDAMTEELPSFAGIGDGAYCALPSAQQSTGQSYLAKGSSDLSSSHQPGVSTQQRDEQIEEAITTPTLRQSSPNPAHDETTIEFGIPTKSYVELTLHNVLGHKVKTIAEGDFSSGWQRFTLIVKDVPPGMYIYRLNVNGKVLTRTFVIVR